MKDLKGLILLTESEKYFYNLLNKILKVNGDKDNNFNTDTNKTARVKT